MIDLRLGDCLEVMPTLAAQSFDAIIADIPYGTTACKWDTVIPFAPMWAELKRLAKPRAAIVLFGSQPFTSALVMSNPKSFKYELIWFKNQPTGIGTSGFRPMRYHENILVFCDGKETFNKQPFARLSERSKPVVLKGVQSGNHRAKNITLSSPVPHKKYYDPETVNPMSVLRINCVPNGGGGKAHPTQKPVALMEYLIRTYTNEGDTVLDFTMGSGTTLVACVNTRRNGTGIEKDAGYYAIAERRVKEAQAQLSMPMVAA